MEKKGEMLGDGDMTATTLICSLTAPTQYTEFFSFEQPSTKEVFVLLNLAGRLKGTEILSWGRLSQWLRAPAPPILPSGLFTGNPTFGKFRVCPFAFGKDLH